MANKDLFEQAIADAKKLKEISMANAKQVIEEAFAPKIQEMFRLKLSEMEDLEEDDYTEDGMENELEANAEDAMMPEYAKHSPESEKEAHKLSEEDMEETTLDEILAELELEEAEETTMEGDDAEMMKEAKDEEESEEEETEEESEETEEASEESTDEVAELSIEEFKNLIRDVVADVMGSQEASTAQGDLESTDEVPGVGDDDETISLDEILAELEEANHPINEASKAAKHAKKKKGEEAKEKKEEVEKKEKESLKEAIETINFLKSQLSEVNLLNAKLLYVNRIFKAKSLTESQKVKVVTAFDRATTTKEAKNIYETLVDSLTSAASSTKKAPIKESFGFASKPIGSAPATPIVEADAYVYRMQQLAGIKQPNI